VNPTATPQRTIPTAVLRGRAPAPRTETLASPQVVVLDGHLDGRALADIAEVLDEALREPRGHLAIDLRSVDTMSLLAQGMILSLARTYARHGGHVTLLAPSSAVVRQGQRLDLFHKVRTVGANGLFRATWSRESLGP